MILRPLTSSDMPDIELVLEETGLFPAEMLEGMTSRYLAGEASGESWVVCEHEGKAVGFAYAVEEQLAEGTWNLLALAVRPSTQGAGVGRALVSRVEDMLREGGHRVLIIETSGAEKFRRTRDFYARTGYAEEARIRDFWANGDDKVIYWKRL